MLILYEQHCLWDITTLNELRCLCNKCLNPLHLYVQIVFK